MKKRKVYRVGASVMVVLLLIGFVDGRVVQAQSIDELRDELSAKKDSLQDAEARIK